MELITKANNEMLFIEPEIRFEGITLMWGVNAGVVDAENDSTLSQKKSADGIHYTNDGQIIVMDAYKWKISDWKIPLIKF